MGLEEFETKSVVNYYPNPVDNYLSISCNNAIEKVMINSILGEELSALLYNVPTDWSIDFTHYNSGIYFVSIHSRQGEDIIKIVKR